MRRRTPVLLLVALGLAVLPAGGRALAAAQGALVEGPSVVVTGLGVAHAPAETATVELLLAGAGAFGPADPAAMAPPPGDAPPEAGTPPAAGGGDQPAGGEPGPAGPAGSGLTETDLAPVADALVAAGVAEEDVQVSAGPGLTSPMFGPGGPPLGRVEAVLREPTQDAVAEALAAADEAAAAAGLAVQQVGVDYDVADCAPLLREARQEAIDAARAEAEELATQAGGALGELLQVASSPAFFFGPPVVAEDSGCPPPPEAGYYGPGSPTPYDPAAPAEVRVYAMVTLTYALSAGDATPAA